MFLGSGGRRWLWMRRLLRRLLVPVFIPPERCGLPRSLWAETGMFSILVLSGVSAAAILICVTTWSFSSNRTPLKVLPASLSLVALTILC